MKNYKTTEKPTKVNKIILNQRNGNKEDYMRDTIAFSIPSIDSTKTLCRLLWKRGSQDKHSEQR